MRRDLVDRTLLDLIPDDVEVVRTGYFDGHQVIRMLGKLHLADVTRMVTPSFPDMDAGWIPYGVYAGAKLLRERPFDLIFSSAYPMCSHVVACGLKRFFGVPWVADYRDEWSQREIMAWPTPLHRHLARRLDRFLTREADSVVTTSPRHTENFASAFPSADTTKYFTVMNGFDREKFEGSESNRPPEREDRFLICHVGSLFHWRSPDSFLSALRRLLRRGVLDPERIAVRFIGSTPALDADDLREAGVVQELGYVRHDVAIDWMKAADVLLLVNTETTNILAKSFEYLASGRPILALCEPGPTADLIRQNDAGTILRPDDVDEIETAIKDLYLRWRAGDLSSRPTEKIAERYSRRATTKRLARVFDSVSSETRPTPVGQGRDS